MAVLAAIEEAQKDLSDFSPELFARLKVAEAEMAEICKKLETELGDDPGAVEEAKKRFRQEITPWYSQSFLMKRATEKPRGYPGDFEILEGIYNNQPRSSGMGSYLDRLFLDDHLAEAVRKRKDLIREMLRAEVNGASGKIRVMNIASGSCREWYELFPTIDGCRLTLTCIDFDQLALDYSRSRLDDRKDDAEIRYVKDNAIKLAVRKGNIDLYGRQDIVYSFGLYDYLNNKALKRLLQAQYELLNENGKMILTFKDRTKYDKTKYGWFCDWYFEQRSEKEVFDILKEIGFDARHISTNWEVTGTIVFFKMTKR